MANDPFYYPNKFIIDDAIYDGALNPSKKEISIPYLDAPKLKKGDSITHKAAQNNIDYTIDDVFFLENQSLNIGTDFPHLLIIRIK